MSPRVMGSRDYPAALEALSSLITKRTRGDGTNRGDSFDLMSLYLKVAGLEEPLSKLSIIHVAGTKGKGSTCTFSESILRECGYKTGLFTSPHLVDVRERFKVNRENVSEEVFLKHFWWCWDRFEMNLASDVPMPTYFRFLTLLAFKIFIDEKVDVAILEVGLGGRFDSTNVVKAPAVCGITSLGFDHMEILGYTLAEIAGEKAGIFKPGVPAFTVLQPEEAMSALQKKASDLDIRLQVVSPLTIELLKGSQLTLEGEHQLLNGALAVSLCSAWAQRRQDMEHVAMFERAMSKGHLPESYIKGLASAQLLGRAQRIQDPIVQRLIFFLDGAHSPESMEVCARWFCSAVHKANHAWEKQPHETDMVEEERGYCTSTPPGAGPLSRRVLLLNCMPQRDPNLLLPPLVNVCDKNGLPFHHAMFVPSLSSYTRVRPDLPLASNGGTGNESEEDLSWQFSIQGAWDNLARSQSEGHFAACSHVSESARPCVVRKDSLSALGKLKQTRDLFGGLSSSVVPSLPVALDLLRQYAQDHPAFQLQVLVTGSLHLVGDVLRLLKR